MIVFPLGLILYLSTWFFCCIFPLLAMEPMISNFKLVKKIVFINTDVLFHWYYLSCKTVISSWHFKWNILPFSEIWPQVNDLEKCMKMWNAQSNIIMNFPVSIQLPRPWENASGTSWSVLRAVKISFLLLTFDVILPLCACL